VQITANVPQTHAHSPPKLLMKTQTSIDAVKQWLLAFASRNGWSPSNCHKMLQVKMAHTLRVANDCKEIATELGWNKEEIFAAESAGLLHDAARFPQFNKYKTFLDRDSIDHGEYAYNIILQENPFLNMQINNNLFVAILTAVRFHNRKNIPPEINGFSLNLLKLVRDADKLDILKVVRDVAENDDYDNHPELLLGKNKNGPPNEELIKEILTTKSGSYEKVSSLADLNLLRLTWVYDINYQPSLKRLKERELYRDLMSHRDINPDVEEIKRQVRNYLEANQNTATF